MSKFKSTLSKCGKSFISRKAFLCAFMFICALRATVASAIDYSTTGEAAKIGRAGEIGIATGLGVAVPDAAIAAARGLIPTVVYTAGTVVVTAAVVISIFAWIDIGKEIKTMNFASDVADAIRTQQINELLLIFKAELPDLAAAQQYESFINAAGNVRTQYCHNFLV